MPEEDYVGVVPMLLHFSFEGKRVVFKLNCSQNEFSDSVPQVVVNKNVLTAFFFLEICTSLLKEKII